MMGTKGVMGVMGGMAAALLLVCGCDSAPQSRRETATRVLGEFLKTNASPRSVLVLSNPFSRQSGRPAEVYEFEKAGMAGLEQGLGEEVPVAVEFPELKPEVMRDPGSVPVDPNTTTPLSFLVAENAFDQAIAKHPECDVVISLIGLPVRLDRVEQWSRPGKPRFALLLPDWRMVGGREAILQAFRSGKLLAAVVHRPGAPGDEVELSDNYQKEFDQRYFLVTAQNAGALIASHPAAFNLR